jgi:uncharacterized protein YdeI (YjbR/CyaY-like superfamily)
VTDTSRSGRSGRNPEVDACIRGSPRWGAEMAELRSVLLGSGLAEELKWGKPCYCHGGRNVAIVQEMRQFLALMFFKGALLDDPHGVLEDQGPNSRSARRVCFTSVQDVARLAGAVRDLVDSAVAAEEAGLEVGPAPEPELVEELARRLDGDPALRSAFEALTPGRRREYNLHVAGAKRAATREARIDRHVPRILEGKGLRDR